MTPIEAVAAGPVMVTATVVIPATTVAAVVAAVVAISDSIAMAVVTAVPIAAVVVTAVVFPAMVIIIGESRRDRRHREQARQKRGSNETHEVLLSVSWPHDNALNLNAGRLIRS
jgi:mannose/fructose/N-acetylgalactosamine-specific phosphotransferase system component IIC